ncbi:hypothetical protein BGX26_001966, partial [Mortierella sp. AD094]
MSSPMAQAACSHIFQTLQGHIIFLNDQGIITDDSLKVILSELCNIDLQAISASRAPSSNASSHSQPLPQPLPLPQPQPLAIRHDNRASIDTDLQMLDLPGRKSTNLGDFDDSTLDSSIPTQKLNSHSHQNINRQHDQAGDSESDYEVESEADRQYQERLLRQEQQLERTPDHSVDIVTGELDNLVAASATDDQDLDESSVAVLEEVDDDDVHSEVKTLDRSLSVSSNPDGFKPELPPLLFSDYLTTPHSALDTTSDVPSTRSNQGVTASNHLSSAVPIIAAAGTSGIGVTAVPHLSQVSQSSAVQPAASVVATSVPVQGKHNEHTETTTAPSPSNNLEQYEHSTVQPSVFEHNQYVPLATTVAAASVTSPVYSHVHHQAEPALFRPTIYSPTQPGSAAATLP